jgi:hypothetical protein
MKENKFPLFLIGLFSVLLVFGFLLIGCPNTVVPDGKKVTRISITTQPVGKTYLADVALADIEPLTVTASEKSDIKYQWYKNTENANWDGTAVSGATSASFTPPNDFGFTYYYAVVTYPKGKLTATSNAAAVGFFDFIITKEPENGEYFPGDDLAPLTVETQNSVITGYAVKYQWYSNDKNDNKGGKVITGATSASYTPTVEAVGIYYYYVVGTGSATSGRESVIPSRAAAVKIQPMAITGNPSSRTYVVGATIAPLTVETSATKGVTYKWYENTTFSNKGGTAIAGADTSSYTPDKTAVGDYFFYATATHAVQGSFTSSPALIQITATAREEAPTQFEIGTTRLNYVRGVGGTGSFMFRTGTNADASPDADVGYIDQLFGELGCNILRIMVQDDYPNYINNAVQSRNEDVFYHNARDNFFPVIRRVNELGGYVFANPWTAPQSMKVTTAGGTTPSPTAAGGYLRETGPNYVDYAEHLRGFMKWLNTNNAPIFCLGILNEPDFGGGANSEGMGMNGGVTRDWFRTVGHFTTKTVTNRANASVTASVFQDEIIPGYGGGGPTHHVLTMSGDSMGDVKAYMDPQLAPATEAVISLTTGSNNRIEVIGRHYYAHAGRYESVAGLPPTSTGNGTPWNERPQLNNYKGPYEAESLAMSRQMYAPGATPDNVKREVWQTEHDFNFHANSTEAPAGNVQNYWNSAFAALNDVDWCLRVMGESVFCWWYSASYSGLVTGYQAAPPTPPRTISPRGRAFAHYARYVNETWLLDINRTRSGFTGNFNTPTGASGSSGYNNTDSAFNAGSVIPKFSAFEDVDGKFISIVMYAPPLSTAGASGGRISRSFGAGGTSGNDDPTRGSVNVGRVEFVLPDGFVATSATAIRSYGNALADGKSWDDVPNGSPRYWIDEPAILAADGRKVEVTLKGGHIISIMVKGEWTGAQLATRHFETRVRPYTVH